MTALAELERTGSGSALGRCTGDPATFLQDTWGRRAAVHEGAEPVGFADLLTFEDVDAILTTTSLRTPAFRLVKAGERIPESAYTRSGTTGSRPVSGLADPGRIAGLFADGATIVLQGLHRYREPVAAFTRALELELGHPCQVNAYITPPGAQGLPLHEDPHDVFVLQAFGRKAWEIHAAPGEAARDPLSSTVASGDAIYMPASTPHAASTQRELSGHLTVGIHVTTWRSVLAGLWDEATGSDPSLDEALPPGWLGDPDGVARGLEARTGRVAERIRGVDAGRLARARADRFLSTRPPLLRGALEDALRVESIDDRTTVERRRGSACVLRRRGERLAVLLGDRRLEMPAWVEPAMRRIAEADRLRVGDLADLLPDAPSRAVLARRLVREGLLRPLG